VALRDLVVVRGVRPVADDEIGEPVPCPGLLARARAVEREQGRLGGRGVVLSGLEVYLADELGAEERRLHEREVLLVQVLTPAEANPDYFGRLQLLDAESVDIDDRKNMRIRITKSEYKAYLQALSGYLEDMKQFCRSRNVGYVTVNTANPIEKELLNSLYETEAIR